MLALHLLQSALVHVNTLLLQKVLDDPTWVKRLNRRRSPCPVPALLVARAALWHLHPGHGYPADLRSRSRSHRLRAGGDLDRAPWQHPRSGPQRSARRASLREVRFRFGFEGTKIVIQ